MIFCSCVSSLQPKFAPAYSSQLALTGFELWISIHPGQHSAHQAYFTWAFWQDSILSWCLTQWISILTHEPYSHYGVISSFCLAASLQTLLFQIKGAVLQRLHWSKREQLSKLKLQSGTQGIFLKLYKGVMNLNPGRLKTKTELHSVIKCFFTYKQHSDSN